MKKRIISIIIFIIIVASFTLPIGAVTLDQYFDGIGTIGQGEGYMFQRSYKSYFQMEAFALASGVPNFDISEDEIRITNNYLPLYIPTTINSGMTSTSNYDASLITVGANTHTTSYQYNNSLYSTNSPYYMVTQVNIADEYGNTSNIKSATLNLIKRDTLIPSSLYFRGSVYGQVINGRTYSVSFSLPYAYKVYIKGGFSIYTNNGELERHSVTNRVFSVNGQYVLDLQSVLGETVYNYLSSSHVLDEWVFSGSIMISADDDTVTQYPSIRVYYNTSKAIMDQMTDFTYSDNYDSYSVFDDPIIGFFTGRYTSAPEELNVTQNGIYNIRKPTRINVNVPQTLEWGGMFEWLFDSMGALMGFEIAPGWSIGIIMTIIVGLAVAIWVLKVFLGG